MVLRATQYGLRNYSEVSDEAFRRKCGEIWKLLSAGRNVAPGQTYNTGFRGSTVKTKKSITTEALREKLRQPVFAGPGDHETTGPGQETADAKTSC